MLAAYYIADEGEISLAGERRQDLEDGEASIKSARISGGRGGD